MYLHNEDRELLKDIIVTVSNKTGIDENIVEKDYYVTMVLRELVKINPEIVFKGGTSLSKAYHVIDRFSEDIDITFEEHQGESRRKKIKYQLLLPVSEKLSLPIDNWKYIESDKDYNHYDFLYKSVCSDDRIGLKPYIKLETALMSYSFPTEVKEISNIIFDCLSKEEQTIMKEYELIPFTMKVQALSRTIIDKLLAVCDYYMFNKPTRNSRHLYDIYKLKDFIILDNNFITLFNDVRKHRENMGIKIAPSAKEDVNVMYMVERMMKDDFYENDYRNSTLKLIYDYVPYEDVKDGYIKIMKYILLNNL